MEIKINTIQMAVHTHTHTLSKHTHLCFHTDSSSLASVGVWVEDWSCDFFLGSTKGLHLSAGSCLQPSQICHNREIKTVKPYKKYSYTKL